MTKIREKEEGVIALPWAALAGSTLTQEWPRRTRPRQDTLIAVPAFRLDGNRRWTAELRFEGRPQTAEPLDRRGWGMRTFRDAPMGLDEVHLVVHYRRWQTRDKSQAFTSPLPEALTGMPAEGMKITPALVSFLQDVQGRLDIPEDLVARSLGYNRRYLKQVRRNRTPSQSTGDTASVHQTDQYIPQ